MLELKDFAHLPQLDTLFEQIVGDGPGLLVVAGLERRARSEFPQSGRPSLFGILVRQLLAAHPRERAVVIAESKGAVRLPRYSRSRVEYVLEPAQSHANLIGLAHRRGFNLLVLEQLTPETIPAALDAARGGMRVVAQFDTIFRGANVARQLLDLCTAPVQLAGLAWVVAVQRVATLCENCKQAETLDPPRVAVLRARYPQIPLDATFFRAGECSECKRTGRRGDIALFDVYRAGANPAHLLPLTEYALGLAARGYLPLAEALQLETNEHYRTYKLLRANEAELAETNAKLERKLTELEVANRVLQQQTEASISLQEIGHALITRNELPDLANYICQKAGALCGADRAVLYLLRPDAGEILAVSGWEPRLVHQRAVIDEMLGGAEARPFVGYPPGIPAREPDVEGVKLRAGLRVPLVAQHEVVGLLIFHSTLKPRFLPREVALLQAFADQSAMAIQRAGLIESLWEKIEQLEAAQREIAQKERLERELELARQVQQSMLPHIFPLAPGLDFWVRSEPARQVGGDFYDVFLLDGTRVGVVIADVSDKGMPAALFMALTRSLLLAEARRERSPYVVLQRVHRLLLELSQSDQFVTLFYGVIDASTHTLSYVRAGHERPLLLRAGMTQALAGEGTILGALDADELRLSEEQMSLQSGDRLVLYTDGLIDGLSPEGEAFGRGRLKRLLEEQTHLSLAEMCEAVFAALRAHQGDTEQYDDMTLLAVEVR
jgi:Stage II sporulation protein E (SpoIIE)/GAF domain